MLLAIVKIVCKTVEIYLMFYREIGWRRLGRSEQLFVFTARTVEINIFFYFVEPEHGVRWGFTGRAENVLCC